MKTILYKGEDITLNFTSDSDLSGYTKVVKYFTPFSATKTATLTPVDNYSFAAKMVKAETADLKAGSLNVVIELTDGSGDKVISKTIIGYLNDAYLDGGERDGIDLDSDVVFANDVNIDIIFIPGGSINVGVAQLSNELKAINNLGTVINWAAGIQYNKTLSQNTTFTDQNLQAGKTVSLFMTGDYDATFPSGYEIKAGEYDGTKNNLIQMYCISASPVIVWMTILN